MAQLVKRLLRDYEALSLNPQAHAESGVWQGTL